MARGRKTGGGSRRGRPNKASADARAMIALIAERNVRRLEKWLLQTADKDPAKAAELFLRALEYHIPKLARTEYAGPHGGAIPIASVTTQVSDEDAMRSYLRMVQGTP